MSPGVNITNRWLADWQSVKWANYKYARGQSTRIFQGRQDMADENIVYIGRKPTMNYVLAVVMQFNSGSDDVIIKARGRSISTAVDVAEIVRNKFVQEAKIKDIQISTEQLTGDEGRTSNVSSIEIFMSK